MILPPLHLSPNRHFVGTRRIPASPISPSFLIALPLLGHVAFSGEDFALAPAESPRSKEYEELPAVLEYIKNNDLENIARKHLDNPS
jgi:hypothetical protein